MTDPFGCVELGAPVASGDVVFVVQAGYHLDDAVSTAGVLAASGQRASIVAPLPPQDALRRWRTSTARHREIAARARKLGLDAGAHISAESIVDRAGALVVRNDWGPSRALVERANAAGVPTVGWVEGVQDFDDVDTGRARHPYGTVGEVMCLGDYDAGRLGHRAEVTPVGSQRLWDLWAGPATSAVTPLVVNVNFTYGVQRAARREWLGQVMGVAGDAGITPVVSRHPADRGLRGRRHASPTGIDQLLPTAARLVTRFSTLVYDALALGVDVVYHNPHGERVPTFTSPMDAYVITTTADELRTALERPVPPPAVVRAAATPFLEHHLVLDSPPPAERASAHLLTMLNRR